MARRAASLSKPQVSTRKAATAKVFEQPAAKTQRRGKQAKLADMPPAEISVADAFFPGAEDMAIRSDTALFEPAKARRGRKPKVQPAPEASVLKSEPVLEFSASTKDPTPRAEEKELDTVAGTPATPSASPRRKRRGGQKQTDVHPLSSTDNSAAPPSTPASAAKWNAEIGTATFDWPGIEHVAATEGPNQAMAKLLLAARAEGANSRWPF